MGIFQRAAAGIYAHHFPRPADACEKTFSRWRSISSAPMYTTHSRPSRAATVAVGHAMLSRARFSAMTRRFPHPHREQSLTEDSY